jgi:hypothetical protein
VSASWLACTLTSIYGSQNGLPSLRYFGLPSAQPLRLALVDPTDRYLRAWKPVPPCLQFDQQRVLSHFFSALLPLSPSSNGRLPPLLWRNEKPRLRSWKLEPNPTAIREGPTERKTALEITGSTIRRPRGIRIRCWTATRLTPFSPTTYAHGHLPSRS